jgi:hypothetical protein
LAGPIANCTTIKDGGLTDSLGNPLETGFDEFGYNYQAHEFNGTYDSADRVFDGMFYGQSGYFVDDNLSMKWSDDWLSNQDCNGDGKLDRGAPGSSGYPNTSQGWTTNHVEGDYDSDGDGVQDAHYTQFFKIVWVGPCEGEEGCVWGNYKVIQTVCNDPTGGLPEPCLKAKLVAPGLGLNDQWTQQ